MANKTRAITTGGKKVVLCETSIACELAKCARFANKAPDRKEYGEYARAVDTLRITAYKRYLSKATQDDVYAALRGVLALVGKVSGKAVSANESVFCDGVDSTLYMDAMRYAVKDYIAITSVKLLDAKDALKKAKKALDDATPDTLDANREALKKAKAEVDRLMNVADNAHNAKTIVGDGTFYKKFSLALSSVIAGRGAEDYDAVIAAAAKADAERRERNRSKKAAKKAA